MPKENKKEDKQKKSSPTQSFRAREIIEEMKESYLDYAMSVIVARALPDVRDGLKPVQRRILYSMYEIGLGSGSKTRKSALVIGDVLGKYHPHGDASVYDAMARMAQDFSLRYPLVQGQGNFGSIDGDPPAAYRYTEAKLAKVADQLLNDIDRNTVDFIDNYDGTRKEPTVLPALLPNLLLNGTMGIAVGMATNIPPHNLGEICDACNYLLDHPKADTEDLFQFVKGPDFPTGGIIYDQKGILAAYSQGRGPIVIRGKAEITEDKQGRPMIIITEIPYQVVKSSLVEQLAALVEEKRVVGIRDIRDESGKEGVRIVIHLTKDVPPQKVLNQLYKYSDLQKSFHLNLLALVGGIQPKVLSLAEALSYYLEHREIVTRRRIAFDLEKAKQRAHILEGLAKCLADIDEVIAIIRRSEDREDAMRNLMKRFKIDEIQANAILETKLAHLAKLERKKIDEELKALKAKIKELNDILGDPKKVKEVMKGEIAKLRAEAGDDRRTKVLARKIEEFSDEDLIPQEEVVITITNSGYIKRMNPEGYRLQKRGGKGSSGMKVSEEDIVEHFVTANTHDSLLFFTNSGKVFRIPAYEVPEGTKGAKGRALMNFLEISANEKVMAVLPIKKEDLKAGTSFLFMITHNGVVKKTATAEFQNIRRSGLIALNLKTGDSLCKVKKTSGDDEIILVTKKGQSVRFKEKDVRPMGRNAAGITGMRLKSGDIVIGMGVINKESKQHMLLIVTERGYGKKTDLKEYRLQKRGGSGIKAMNVTPKTGDIATGDIISGEEEDLIVVSGHGQVIRTPLSAVSKLSRTTQGVRLMKLDEGEKASSITSI